MAQKSGTLNILVGDYVRIRQSMRSPYAGETGTVSEIQMNGSQTVYLVHFDDGLLFSYNVDEIEHIGEPREEGWLRPGGRSNPRPPTMHSER